ncbi:HAD-IIIA family hydrolase [Azospirillum sp. B4]|uniref:HAD-IIIA family hydrolase n=1 Tax=Azospirillum sp. B4 TaxID=95605 RepID=UPI00034D800B|nr:HAD-IIIA family hydrolase [Azospirillum sp. B4]
MLTGADAEALAAYCGDGARWGLRVRVARTADVPPDQAVAVISGDLVLDVDLDRLLDHHRRHGAAATLLVQPVERPAEVDLVRVDSGGRVRGRLPAPRPAGQDAHNLAWRGPLVLEPGVLESGSLGTEAWGWPLVDRLLAAGRPVQAYQSPEYVRAIATPGDLARAQADVASGHAARLSLRHPLPAVFLDRDGVLNVERSHIRTPDALEVIPGAVQALARLNRAGYRTPVVTNQAAVARGLVTLETLDAIHARLETRLGAGHAYVDRLYFCPHHPDPTLAGGVPALLVECDCRKPGPGMARAAARDLNIDLPRSWMIGDSSTDMGLARAAGMGGILVRDGHGGRDGKCPAQPHVVVDDMADGVRFILDVWPRLAAHLDSLAAGIQAGETVLIGGLARSGKSLLAQCLSLRLGQRGRRAVVIGLDSWAKSRDRRQPGVLGRYDLAAARAALDALLVRGTPVTPPRYDPVTQTSHPGVGAVALGPDDILIVEGVPALTQAEWRDRAAHRLYVGTEEGGRQARFTAEYRRRGWSDAAVRETFEQRVRDETPIVLASKDHADRVVSLDGILD